LKEDGSFRLNMDYFGYCTDLTMTTALTEKAFGGSPRKPESRITQREMDLAASIQAVTNEIVIRMARHAVQVTGSRNLCLAGGVALNCVANGRLARSGICDDLWIQPAAGDAGGALGCALHVWHYELDKPRVPKAGEDLMQGAYLGPGFSDYEIQMFLDQHGYPYAVLDPDAWAPTLASLVNEGNVIGIMQGRMEFGPRALGNRSIVADARSPRMQSVLNLKIKFREGFRPFAPACLEDRAADFFELDRPSPYMLLVADVRREHRKVPDRKQADDLQERLNQVRSDIPAVTHVDYSARIQTVSAKTNPRFAALLHAMQDLTGYPIVINTSFNVRDEPIVCTPVDAYSCFIRTEMDYLSLGSFLLRKTDQPSKAPSSSLGPN